MGLQKLMARHMQNKGDTRVHFVKDSEVHSDVDAVVAKVIETLTDKPAQGETEEMKQMVQW